MISQLETDERNAKNFSFRSLIEIVIHIEGLEGKGV